MGEVSDCTVKATANGMAEVAEGCVASAIAGHAAEAIAAAIPAYEGDERPIGIFDSGLGGLTVARAISQALPHESICYIGDTERCPYGVRSEAEVRSFVLQVGSWLTRQNVKMIIIACNTATTSADTASFATAGGFIFGQPLGEVEHVAPVVLERSAASLL